MTQAYPRQRPRLAKTAQATGPRSEIGTSLSLLETETPPLQCQLLRLMFWFARAGGRSVWY